MPADYARINNTLGKMGYYLGQHNNILVSVSGGSDSDIVVHLICTNFPEFLPKCHFVFFNTGLEYQATLNHLTYLEERYKITIERIRGVSVVNAVHKHGVPIISKRHSQYIHGWLRGTAPAGDKVVMGTAEKYAFSKNQTKAAQAIKERGIAISARCCDVSKKLPAQKYMKEHGIDLDITGERRAEGGIRAFAHKNCFEENNHGVNKYMPLYFWDDDTKAFYKKTEEIVYSDCYEKWGLKRTGCVGCPFNGNLGEELNIVLQYEPKMVQACLNVFGTSYHLSDEFNLHRKKINPELLAQKLNNPEQIVVGGETGQIILKEDDIAEKQQAYHLYYWKIFDKLTNEVVMEGPVGFTLDGITKLISNLNKKEEKK